MSVSVSTDKGGSDDWAFTKVGIPKDKIENTSQLVNELRSEPSLLSSIIREIPELNQLPQMKEEENISE